MEVEGLCKQQNRRRPDRGAEPEDVAKAVRSFDEEQIGLSSTEHLMAGRNGKVGIGRKRKRRNASARSWEPFGKIAMSSREIFGFVISAMTG
jgi:hypothetical protein